MTDTMDVLDPESGAYDMKPVGLLSAAHGEEAERIPAIVNRPGVCAIGCIHYPARTHKVGCLMGSHDKGALLMLLNISHMSLSKDV